MMNDVDLAKLQRQLPYLDPAQKARVLQLLEERDRLAKLTDCREHFIPFVKAMWPGFIPGAHHTLMGEKFDRVARGECKRLIINMAPRHTKSELASWLLPSWFLGRNPTRKIIQASATENLASGFGRKVRNLVGGENIEDQAAGTFRFDEVFPGVSLSKDSKAAAGWHTNRGGEYFAVGVNGAVTGKGGDIVILDDVHTEQQAKMAESDPGIYDSAYEWYRAGPRQRLQPGGSIIIVMTRWSRRDLTGRLLDAMKQRGDNEYGDKWEVLELPAILDEGLPTERSMWPGFWPLEELRNTREEIGPAKFRAQYQQAPTSEAGAIIKQESWRKWGVDRQVDIDVGRSSCPAPQHRVAWNDLSPPACDYVIMSWDTAMKKNERADYSAMTSWGVFKIEDPTTGKTINNIILLSAFKARLEFPELKKKVKQFYLEDQPDTLLIEDKGSGISLIQELRSTGTPVENFSYGRGGAGLSNDKVARANLVSDIFASGFVWMPERRWAEDVALEVAEFPNSSHDDYVDSTVQAMLRFRAGGFIRTANDEEEDDMPRTRRKRYY